MNAELVPTRQADSEPGGTNKLVIFQHDEAFTPGMPFSVAASLQIHRNRRMLAQVVNDTLGLQLRPGYQAWGRMVLAQLDPGLLISSGTDHREAVLSALSDFGRVGAAMKVANSSQLAASSEASAALQRAKKELEELSTIRLESGRLLVEAAVEWLGAFGRVREQIFTLAIPGGRSVEIVIPVHQHVKPADAVTPMKNTLRESVGRPAQILGRCRLIRTLDGRRFVLAMSESAGVLQAGSKLRIPADALKRAGRIAVRRVSADASCGVGL